MEKFESYGTLPRVYTTSEVAKAVNISQQTVIRDAESGRLGSFYIPNSTHRRIPQCALDAYQEEHSLILQDSPEYTIVITGDMTSIRGEVSKLMSTTLDRVTILNATSFADSMEMMEAYPNLIYVQPGTVGEQGLQLLQQYAETHNLTIEEVTDVATVLERLQAHSQAHFLRIKHLCENGEEPRHLKRRSTP